MVKLPPFILAAAALSLAACATPRERCVAQARSNLTTLNELAAETRGNLARGFALGTRTEVRTVRTTCTGTNEDGSTFTFACDEIQTRDRRVRVAIDLAAEEAKLRSLEARIAREEQAAASRVQSCIATYPE